MLAFPYLIRKFFALKMYCENAFAKNRSLIFTIAKNPLFDSLIVVGSEFVKLFPKLSACAVLLNCFIETVKSLFTFSLSVLFK